MTAIFPAEIRTDHLPNTSLQRCRDISLLGLSLYNKAVMVLGKIMSAHALVAGSTDSAGRWIYQQRSLVIFMKNDCLEWLLDTRILFSNVYCDFL
jgi:hypothetical protein